MRKLVFTVTLLAVFAGANAQEKTKTNYWVVETNAKSSEKSIVRIYDSQNNLVNETDVDRVIDVRSKKERKMLNRMARQNTVANSSFAYSKKKSKTAIGE